MQRCSQRCLGKERHLGALLESILTITECTFISCIRQNSKKNIVGPTTPKLTPWSTVSEDYKDSWFSHDSKRSSKGNQGGLGQQDLWNNLILFCSKRRAKRPQKTVLSKKDEDANLKSGQKLAASGSKNLMADPAVPSMPTTNDQVKWVLLPFRCPYSRSTCVISCSLHYLHCL